MNLITRKTMRKIFLMLLIVMIAVTAGTAAEAARKKVRKAAPQPDRYASIVIEADTGYVLSEKNPDKKLYPASLTKMMTLYLTFEALEQGKLQKYSRLPVSKRAAFQEPSELGLTAGTSIRVEDAILGLVTKSANDVAVVLAEGIGGSETRFAAMMTAKAKALGMANTRFVNASGLHHPSQVSSARDMARLGQALIKDFPSQYRYFSTSSFTFAGKTYGNHNHLMKTYKGMDGLKTGYVYASGYNLAASAKRDGTRLIGVVFGGRTAKSRNDHMAQILDAAFNKTQDLRVARLIEQRRQGGAADTELADAGTLPLPKPSAPTTSTTAVAQNVAVSKSSNRYAAQEVADASPQFNAMGLAMGLSDEEQGDTENDDVVTPLSDDRVVALKKEKASFTQDFQPRSLNTTTMASAATANGGWSVQVGAFSSHEAGMSALQSMRSKLPAHITGGSQYTIAPLMTNRGMIYRARLAGLGREQATHACRILQGNCLILATR